MGWEERPLSEGIREWGMLLSVLRTYNVTFVFFERAYELAERVKSTTLCGVGHSCDVFCPCNVLLYVHA